ncbi:MULTISPECIES: M23 family metallopeptidase [unclassified Sphingomonas]|uniref:M23 family metallopeptidase n=1 Tax=unclassified Sphingomonas TaxID=196159 RepID=UPI0009E8101E|nr:MULTISPECIES: M23 family metallopeptidase [unclassified Sphingomonas]
MFLRGEIGLDQAGGTSARSTDRATSAAGIPAAPATAIDRLRARFPDFELVPDLGSDIGSRVWLRGVATCAGLLTFVALLSPGIEPVYGAVTPVVSDASLDEVRSLSISPLGLGATTGMRLGATARVAPLTDTPERPIIELAATLAQGTAFERVLTRSGVGSDDAERAAALVANAVSLGEIAPGTRLNLTLGRRAAKTEPRPLEKLAFRARFDLALELKRAATGLALNEIPIAIDRTPLRIRGTVGSSLYRSARAAGAPAKAVEAYIRSLATRVPIGRVGSDDEFDIIIEQARAETGEVQLGKLLFAGLDQGKREIQLVRWEQNGRTEWFDAKGVGERRGLMNRPVPGRVTSGFGYRRHPVLGYQRLHKGLDLAAPHGTPIRAADDGVVAMAGWNGGYGKFVKLSHGGGMATGYGHMSRIAVSAGERVRAGEVIGYVGSTGLSTGPHLHYELWKNGGAVNPSSVSFSTVLQLGGEELRRFKAQLNRLMAVPAAGTTASRATAASKVTASVQDPAARPRG